MSSSFPKHWLPMIIQFRSLILELKLEFDSEKFGAGWIKLGVLGSDILQVLSNAPMGEWPWTLARLRTFRHVVGGFMATRHDVNRPDLAMEYLAKCRDIAEILIDGEPQIDYVPEHVAESEPIEDPAKALVAPVAPVALSSPPWRKKIAPAVKECLLAYLNEKIENFTPKTSYRDDPGKLALLVRKQIVIAMKSKKSPFVPKEGRWPVGRTAGHAKLITFDGVENPTKKG